MFSYGKLRPFRRGGQWWNVRLKINLFLLDYVEKSEEFASKIRKFEIDSKTLNRMNTAGVDPLMG